MYDKKKSVSPSMGIFYARIMLPKVQRGLGRTLLSTVYYNIDLSV